MFVNIHRILLFRRNVESFHIRAGSTNYYEDGELYYPTEIVVHPNFIDPHEGFDIALIKVIS